MKFPMFSSQDVLTKTSQFLAIACLVICIMIATFITNVSFALAQEPPVKNNPLEQVKQTLAKNSVTSMVKTEFAFEPRSGILGEVNQKFHEDYDQLIQQITSTFGQPGGRTVIMLMMDRLIIYHDGQKEEQQFIPPIYHQLKAIAHHPVTLYATLQPFVGKKLTSKLKDDLIERSRLLQAALKDLEQVDWSKNLVNIQKSMITDSIEYINQVLADRDIKAEKQNDYVYLVSPKIVQSTNFAAAAELESINGRVKKKLSEQKWESPYVVICNAHQSRHGDLLTQYFERLFNEPQGEGAERENRIVYAESIIDDESKAFRLLATHILDQEIAMAFFQDAKRAQSDILMDAASFWLWEHSLDIPRWP